MMDDILADYSIKTRRLIIIDPDGNDIIIAGVNKGPDGIDFQLKASTCTLFPY